MGHGTEPAVAVRPSINEAAVMTVETHFQDAMAKGALLLTGGKRHALGGFFEPTVFTGVTQARKVAREETFWLLSPLFRFSSDEVEVLGGTAEARA